MILFCVTLAMFGSAMYMLQLNIHNPNDALIEEIFGVFFLDIMINQYLLSLGEFSSDGFKNHS